MNQPQFIETIKVKDGIFYNLPLHIARLEKTAIHFFGKVPLLQLTEDMIPEQFRNGLVKCRVTYSSEIISIEFESYAFRRPSTLALVECDDINYSYKSTDRNTLNALYSQRGDSDDILIVKSGLITDTFYANVVFENSNGLFTPTSYLLHGTKRECLLKEGIIKQMPIAKTDLVLFDKIYLINAMIDLEDEVCISVSNVIN